MHVKGRIVFCLAESPGWEKALLQVFLHTPTPTSKRLLSRWAMATRLSAPRPSSSKLLTLQLRSKRRRTATQQPCRCKSVSAVWSSWWQHVPRLSTFQLQMGSSSVPLMTMSWDGWEGRVPVSLCCHVAIDGNNQKLDDTPDTSRNMTFMIILLTGSSLLQERFWSLS